MEDPQVLPTLLSERLVLRPHTSGNLRRMLAWENDDELLYLSSDTLEHTSEEEMRGTLERMIQGAGDMIHLAMHLKDTGNLIGFVQIAHVDRHHKRCEIGVVVGEKALWGRGYGREALKLAVDYCFTGLNMNRIGAEVYAVNHRAIRMLERFGFKREGVLREKIFRDGFTDEYVYGLLRREYASGSRFEPLE